LLSYLLLIITVLLISTLIYANRRQSRVTARFGEAEADVDLTYRPPVPKEEPELELAALAEQARDPALAQMSDQDLVMEVLKECQDPDIPLNIVELGLVYEVSSKKDSVQVKMSLTSPGCPSSESIQQDVRAKLEDAGFPNPQVEIVWDPPWTPHRISEEGKKTLGM
jgi:metal-sulfur cluster biosynthetic enzyme